MKKLYLLFLAVITLSFQAFGQDGTFTSVKATPLNTIQLYWNSNTNEYYEVDYANALGTNADGTTAWQPLYTGYPAQGTNTIWCDAGNFSLYPFIPNPASQPMRFYRVLVQGTNTGSDNLSLSITSLTNGATLSGQVTVSVQVNSSQIVSSLYLYLDGQELPQSPDGTNFTFNTCNFWNGSHTLFATTRSQSGLDGSLYTTITYNQAVSPVVNVTFVNLITDLQYSQPFFQPSLGQTQLVTASFAANSDWTLQIQDQNDNTVLTTNGSGMSMAFYWDGTGQGETNIPDGMYNYVVSAETNGLGNNLESGGGTNGGSGPILPEFMSEDQMFAVNTNISEDVIPLAILPPGMTNGYTIFSATPLEVQSLHSEELSDSSPHRIIGGFTPDEDPDDDTPTGQSTTNSGPKNDHISFGICYQTYGNANTKGTSPLTGNPYPDHTHVAIDGLAENDSGLNTPLPSTPTAKDMSLAFAQAMEAEGNLPGFIYADDQVTPQLLEKPSLGGQSIFNTVNFGLLILHGSYGTTAESDGVKYTYLWLENQKANSAQNIHLSDCDFGGPTPTNGLMFMTICSCSTLNHTDVNSMSSHGKYPHNGNLHILLGANTNMWSYGPFGQKYGYKLATYGDPVIECWDNAGSEAYSQIPSFITNTVVFAYSYWPNCVNDSIYVNEPTDSGDGLLYGSQTVFTYPP